MQAPLNQIYRGFRISNTGAQTVVAKRWIARGQSGYTGARPTTKPMPVHGYTFYQYDVQARWDSWYSEDNQFVVGDHLSADTIWLDFPDLPSDVSLYNRAVDALNDKTRGSLDLSVDIAEMGQTRRMMRVTDQINDHWTNLTRKTNGLLKVPASLWLTWTYGLRPLANSLYGAADETVRFVLNKTQRFSARATEYVPLGRVSYYTNGYAQVFQPTNLRMKRSYTLGVDLDTPSGFDLTRWSGLNPVSLAWELLPYSFVVDWVFNIGGYLRNLETAILYMNRFRSGYKTNLRVVEGAWDNITRTSDVRPWWLNHATGSINYLYMKREVLSSYPAPRFPSFDARLGSSRLLSAASLMANQLSAEFKTPKASRKLVRDVQRFARSL